MEICYSGHDNMPMGRTQHIKEGIVMRKITTLLTTLVLILSLVVCVAPTSAAEGGTAPETVAFDDPVLEAMVRAAMVNGWR
jgi:hypothetical protein